MNVDKNKSKKKRYVIKYTVWEYYEVEASNKKEALLIASENPYFVDYRNKRIVKDG